MLAKRMQVLLVLYRNLTNLSQLRNHQDSTNYTRLYSHKHALFERNLGRVIHGKTL